jgi:hypothetical protein
MEPLGAISGRLWSPTGEESGEDPKDCDDGRHSSEDQMGKRAARPYTLPMEYIYRTPSPLSMRLFSSSTENKLVKRWKKK